MRVPAAVRVVVVVVVVVAVAVAVSVTVVVVVAMLVSVRMSMPVIVPMAMRRRLGRISPGFGLERFVRIRDMQTIACPSNPADKTNNVGFDLDAISIVNAEHP